MDGRLHENIMVWSNVVTVLPSHLAVEMSQALHSYRHVLQTYPLIVKSTVAAHKVGSLGDTTLTRWTAECTLLDVVQDIGNEEESKHGRTDARMS